MRPIGQGYALEHDRIGKLRSALRILPEHIRLDFAHSLEKNYFAVIAAEYRV
jgi:hypothetical protein